MNEEVKKKKKKTVQDDCRNPVEYQRNTSALMNCYIIQLSHEGEVNTLRGIVVLVFTTSVG